MSRHRGRRLVAISLLVLPLALSARADEGGSEPTAVVERLHGKLIEVMKEAATLGYDGREGELRPIVLAAYDLGFMARKSVGRHWKRLSESERETFVAIFIRLTVANYAGRFDGYSGERFETLGHEPGVHDTVLVKTRLVRPDDDPVQLDYRLHRAEDGWRIIDVYMNGTISELALRRSEYSALLKREGFASLIQALDEKIANLRQG